MNISNNVNMKRGAPIAIHQNEAQLAEKLKTILAQVQWLQGWEMLDDPYTQNWDIIVQLPHHKGRIFVECKAQFSPSLFPQLNQRQCSSFDQVPQIRVLAMPRISPRMAELCQENGWGWYDLAGNCRLELPGVLYIERTGRKPIAIPKEPEANLGTPEASRVVRALLNPATAGRRWTQRDLVVHLQELNNGQSPSLGLVNKVVQFLKEQAYLKYLPDRGFRLDQPEPLLPAWCQAYPYKKHQRRRYFTLLPARTLFERLQSIQRENPGKVCYMGFSAADFQAPNVRQPRTWLYVIPDFEQHLRQILEAKLVDSGENLVVMLPYERGVFDSLESGKERLACTNPVQTYLDLFHSGSRGEEAAQAILEQRLRPIWRNCIS